MDLFGGNHWLFACFSCVVAIAATAYAFYCLKVRTKAELKAKNARELIDNLAEGVYRSSLEGKQLSANPALVAINGYDTEAELLEAVGDIGVEWYVDPNRRNEFSQLLKENGSITNFVSEIYRHKTRERIWISENARLVFHPKTKKPLYYEGTVRDITDTIVRNRTEKLIKNLTDKLPMGLFHLKRWPDKSFTCPYVSRRFREMSNLGMDEEFTVESFTDYIHPEDLPAYMASIKKSGVELSEWECDFRFARPDGKTEWCRIQATPEKEEDGSIVWYGYVSNISERRQVEDEMNRLAYLDSLTGLSNRMHFVEEAKTFLESDDARGNHSAICFIDLDNFKLLNDSHGHGFGDKLLQHVAERLKENVKKDDLLSRFGGDEFVIMLKSLGADPAAARSKVEQISRRLLKEIQRGFLIDGIDCPMTISLGISMFETSEVEEIGELLKSADIAMYEAKKSGRNNSVFYDASAQKEVAETYELQRDIQTGIKDGQFELELQPQVTSEGKIVCAETLIRWNHPTRGRIMPADFITLAEQTGQIGILNDWVLIKSVKILSSWQHEETLREIALSVNISPRQILDHQFISKIIDLLNSSNVPPERLMLEMTEHVMARDPETVERHMQQLQDIGVRFSLDDFGTGYSSISQLRQFPFNELKIDGSFVADVADLEEAKSLVTAIVNMAKALGLQTVAEHVSSQDQFELLSNLGCDLFQGFMFSRSLPVSDFEQLALVNIPRKNRSQFIQLEQSAY